MKITVFAALVLCIIGCERTGSRSRAMSDTSARQAEDRFVISRAYLDDIKQRRGIVLVDAIIQPGERVEVPTGSSITRIGVCVDRQANYSDDKGFVSLAGSDGAILAGDGLSEYAKTDRGPVTASFVLMNEGRNPRRAIVYAIKAEPQR